MRFVFNPIPFLAPRRRVFMLLALGVSMTALLLGLMLPWQATPAAGQTLPNQALVVIQFDAAARVARPIEFTDAISGLKALDTTGIEVITRTYSFGDAVCSIGGVGCPAEDCFCSSNYWSYWYWDGATWQGYATGAGTSVISQTGAIEGWRWGQFGDTLLPVTPTIQAQAAHEWLASRQSSAGDFGGAGATVEMLLALGANRQRNELANRYLAVNGASYARSGVAAAGKLATALAAGDACLPAGALTPASYFSPTLGAFSTQSGANAWAILGSVAMGEALPGAAADYLAAQSQPSGGWEWAPGWGTDTNATALVLQALVAAGEPITSSVVSTGLAYLASVQIDDGGFPYAGGAAAASDANSTAYVLQALFAAGEDPLSPRWTKPGGNPFDYLATVRLPDGSFEWKAGSGSNQLATQQVIPALLGHPNPVQRQAIVACPALYLPLVGRD